MPGVLDAKHNNVTIIDSSYKTKSSTGCPPPALSYWPALHPTNAVHAVTRPSVFNAEKGRKKGSNTSTEPKCTKNENQLRNHLYCSIQCKYVYMHIKYWYKIVSDVHDFLFYPIYSYLLVGNLVNSLFTLQYIFVFFKFNAHHDSKCSSWGIFEGYPPWNLAVVRKPSKKRKQSSSKHQFAGANCWFQHNNGNSQPFESIYLLFKMMIFRSKEYFSGKPLKANVVELRRGR